MAYSPDLYVFGSDASSVLSGTKKSPQSSRRKGRERSSSSSSEAIRDCTPDDEEVLSDLGKLTKS
ncbi:hypothetical protein Bca52824_031345 [Brassica carinata]|uniref:Uncharacterized protein n=1 Tax=Brassica carinata TaxID=52824 RepID=A0A8X7SEV6_BRACI|nr:hypothetical protein Bca52824_031345 [Brassica carinata]